MPDALQAVTLPALSNAALGRGGASALVLLLLTASDADLVVAVADRLRREHHRLEARAADGVDGHRGHALRQAALDDGLPRRVLARARGQDLAEDDLADLLAGEARALEQVGDD